MTKESFWRISGSMTLLAAYALTAALPLSFSFDLFLLGAVGLFLCSRWNLKGCSYALMLLSLSGICGHLFLETHHLLRLGLEASLACSFFAAAVTFENEAEAVKAMSTQLTSRAAAIQNLEEEIGKTREVQVEMQLTLSKKIEELQKNYDEIGTEKSSLEILNDVLRKANAAEFEEKKILENLALEEKRRVASREYDLEALQEKFNHFQQKELISQNRSLQALEDLKQDRAELLERLAAAEEKVHDLAKVDAQYRQLKDQFEEKGRILHETRCQLFKAETDLQTLAIEKEEQNSLPERLRVEFDRLEREITDLQEENLQLQELVSVLTQKQTPSPPFAANRTPLPAGKPSLEETLRETLIPKRKKKLAKKPAQQDLLF